MENITIGLEIKRSFYIPQQSFTIRILENDSLVKTTVDQYHGKPVTHPRIKKGIWQLNNGQYLIEEKSYRKAGLIFNTFDDYLLAREKAAIIRFNDSDEILINYDYDGQEAYEVLKMNQAVELKNLSKGDTKVYKLIGGEIGSIEEYPDLASRTLYIAPNLEFAILTRLVPEGSEIVEEEPEYQKKKRFIEADNFVWVDILNGDSSIAFMKQNQGRINSELTALSGLQASLLKDKRVVEGWGMDEIFIYENEDSYRAVYSAERISIRKKYDWYKGRSTPLFCGLIKDSEEFKTNLEKNIAELTHLLGLNPEKLDKSVNSLEVIDSVLFTYYPDVFFIEKLAVPLLSYYGEVVRINTNGKYYFKTFETPERSLLPIIITENGLAFEYGQALAKAWSDQQYDGQISTKGIFEGFQIGNKLSGK